MVCSVLLNEVFFQGGSERRTEAGSAINGCLAAEWIMPRYLASDGTPVHYHYYYRDFHSYYYYRYHHHCCFLLILYYYCVTIFLLQDGDLQSPAEPDQKATVRGRSIKLPSRFANTDAAEAKAAALAATSGKPANCMPDKPGQGTMNATTASAATCNAKRPKRGRGECSALVECAVAKQGEGQSKRRRVATRYG